MPLRFHILLGALLAVHLFFRVQARRKAADEDGREGALAWWRLRLLPPERYPTPQGRRYRSLAIGSALLFMVVAVLAMLKTHGGLS